MITTLFDVELRPGRSWSNLYVPLDAGQRPAILLLHGSESGWSGWMHVLAMRLAMNGFVAFCHPYSRNGNGWHAGDIHDIDLEGTVEALAWLRGQSCVAGKVGLYGWSRGGEHALLVTSLMVRDGVEPLPDAVAVHAPSDTIVGAFISSTADPKGADAWDPSLRSWRWKGTSEGLLPSTPIEIERYAGPVFISHGEDDTVWSVASSRRLRDRLAAAGCPAEVHLYPGADHVLDPAAENTNNERLVAFFNRVLLPMPSC